MDVVSVITKLFQDSDMTCVPKKYETLEAQFQLGKQRVDGPDADFLIVTDCGCTTYFHCQWLKNSTEEQKYQ